MEETLMTIKQKEEQILRIKQASFEAGLNEALEKELRSAVVRTVQTTLEAALVEEVEAHLVELSDEKPRRSGYYERTLDTQYGAIEDLAVPKLRNGNAEREWQILQRYERSLSGLLDYASYLYVMGLSLRDLQEALYFLLDKVLSLSAVNRVTLRVAEQMQRYRQARLTQSPSILLVDGVWVEICYAQEASKIDQAGHQRQCRAVQERVILAALAIYPDGSHSLLHYTVCLNETSESWLKLFDELIQRGLDPAAVQLIVSDGAKGLLDAMKKRLPQAKQQRCITHKVRGMEQKLTSRLMCKIRRVRCTCHWSHAKVVGSTPASGITKLAGGSPTIREGHLDHKLPPIDGDRGVRSVFRPDTSRS